MRPAPLFLPIAGYAVLAVWMGLQFGWGGTVLAYAGLSAVMAATAFFLIRGREARAAAWFGAGMVAYTVIAFAALMRGSLSLYTLAQLLSVSAFSIAWTRQLRKAAFASAAAGAVYAALFAIDALILPAIAYVLCVVGLAGSALAPSAAEHPDTEK